MYKFQTSRAPDRDAEGIEGEEWGGDVWGSIVSSPSSGVRGGALADNEFWRMLQLEKHT